MQRKEPCKGNHTQDLEGIVWRSQAHEPKDCVQQRVEPLGKVGSCPCHCCHRVGGQGKTCRRSRAENSDDGLEVHPEGVDGPDDQVELPVQASVFRKLLLPKAHGAGRAAQQDVSAHRDEAETGSALRLAAATNFIILLLEENTGTGAHIEPLVGSALCPFGQLHFEGAETTKASAPRSCQYGHAYDGRDDSDSCKGQEENDVAAEAVLIGHGLKLLNGWEPDDVVHSRKLEEQCTTPKGFGRHIHLQGMCCHILHDCWRTDSIS
mmetsp:Transcript_81682/g.170928  ORF Transcript_81682/g.170928 Transcript_81682/m.170928 type:complete len:265 (-) Transcript_81682:33-827(-)